MIRGQGHVCESVVVHTYSLGLRILVSIQGQLYRVTKITASGMSSYNTLLRADLEHTSIRTLLEHEFLQDLARDDGQ